MIAERLLSTIVHGMTESYLKLDPVDDPMFPPANPEQKTMLYLHVPFCERLCPYCSFNRYTFREEIARPYFQSMRQEMRMLKDLDYNIESIYMGGGTPTVLLDELCETLDLARDLWEIREVASETNPNHLTQPWLDELKGRVQRLSVGVQSFDDGLLKQMDRYDKYGSGEEIMERIAEAHGYFDQLNVDMIFNFPTQTEEILFSDLEKIALCGCHEVTFSPLYISNCTRSNMEKVLGKLDYDQEYRFYQILDGVLAEGDDALFDRTTLWTFKRKGADEGKKSDAIIDEYMTFYDEYPALGSGSITHLDGHLYVNTFSLREYNEAIAAGHMSIMGKAKMTKRNAMRYCFLVNLYKCRLDKAAFKREFGVSVEAGLPVEMAFMRLNGAFDEDNAERLTLTPRGRYLTTVMYRQFLSGMNNLRDQARDALSGPERELIFDKTTK